MPIYSGGLGILAGDHLKSASDLGIPLVGIGLYYDQGYFRQRLDRDGWQHEEYIDVDHRLLPMQPATRDGLPVTVEIETRTGTHRRARLADGGRPDDAAAARLERRGQQPGGSRADRAALRRRRPYPHPAGAAARASAACKALAALGISPGVIHLNEGHSAFAALELIRCRMDAEGISVDEATRRVASQVVFTTHTPVPAGHDRFAPDLVEEHLGPVRDGARAVVRVVPRARAREPVRSARRVLHDRAGAQVLSSRQRRVVAARSGLTRDVDAAVSGRARGAHSDRPRHQRRARQHLARAADAPGLRPAPRRQLDGAQRRSRRSGTRSRRSTTASCGRRIRRSRPA